MDNKVMVFDTGKCGDDFTAFTLSQDELELILYALNAYSLQMGQSAEEMVKSGWARTDERMKSVELAREIEKQALALGIKIGGEKLWDTLVKNG